MTWPQKVGCLYVSQVQLNLSKGLFAPKFFPLLFDYSHRFEFYMGSAGSGKSYFITQKLIIRALQEPIRILVCRRYGTTIRQTVFSLFKQIITKWNLLSLVKINESDFRIRFVNGSEIIFTGLDEETKLLSLNDIGTIFIEEAYEVPYDMVEQLNLRMRGSTVNQQILMAWNPISKDSWIYDFTVANPPLDSIFIHSTYKDNPFLNKEYIKSLEELYVRNPAKARIFCDGEWGIIDEGLVFRNWKVEEFDVNVLVNSHCDRRAGADLGYIDPTAVVDSLYDRNNSTIYVCSCFYRSGLQLDITAQEMEKMIGKRTKCYMDSAEPRSIEYFRQRGFNVRPCIKGQGSVQARITFLQNQRIIVHPSCQDLIRELENFSYIKDKRTNKYTENTTHEFSHAIDALGYSYSDIYTNNKLRTLDKSVLGL